MPYISRGERQAWAGMLAELRGDVRYNADAGDVNYIITSIMHAWLGDNPNYAAYNQAIGVLECAKLELYSQKVRPYEDEKRKINGDL